MNLRLKQNNVGGYFNPLNVCVAKTNEYVQHLNLKFVILPLSPAEDSLDDQHGLRQQLLNNRSFIESIFNPDPPKPPAELDLYNETETAEKRVGEVMTTMILKRPRMLVMLVSPPESRLTQPHQRSKERADIQLNRTSLAQ